MKESLRIYSWTNMGGFNLKKVNKALLQALTAANVIIGTNTSFAANEDSRKRDEIKGTDSHELMIEFCICENDTNNSCGNNCCNNTGCHCGK